MRWDFWLFFASLAATALGGLWGAYIGVAGMAVFGMHGLLASLASQKARKMTILIGLIASGAIFIALAAFYLKPGWFGLNETSDVASVSSETGRLVSQAQFARVAELEKFLGGKDENDLREAFDLRLILEKNIHAQASRLSMLLAGRYSEFKYDQSSPLIFWAKEGFFTTGPSGVHAANGPNDILFLETTQTFQAATKKLTEFLNSAFVPASIKEPLAGFNDAINQYTATMLRVLDARAHDDDNYFFQNMTMGTRYYGVIQSDLATQVKPLKPAADRVLAAISRSWKISQ
jgi:hypothetical protein